MNTMTLQTFAQQHRLKVTKDQCGDQIIKGRRGHLYFDGPELCLMILDGPVRAKSVLKAIGGKLWTGDKSAGEIHVPRCSGSALLVAVSADRQEYQPVCCALAERLQGPLPRHRGPYASLLPLLC